MEQVSPSTCCVRTLRQALDMEPWMVTGMFPVFTAFYWRNSGRAFKKTFTFCNKGVFPSNLLAIEENPGYQHRKNDNIKCDLSRVNLITILKTCYDMMSLTLENVQKDYSSKWLGIEKNSRGNISESSWKRTLFTTQYSPGMTDGHLVSWDIQRIILKSTEKIWWRLTHHSAANGLNSLFFLLLPISILNIK